jgi:hypothetical protein
MRTFVDDPKQRDQKMHIGYFHANLKTGNSLFVEPAYEYTAYAALSQRCQCTFEMKTIWYSTLNAYARIALAHPKAIRRLLKQSTA